MTPERWQQIKEVLAGALETHPPDRSAYLDEVCGSDKALRAEVESLLAAEGDDPDMLNARTVVGTLDEKAERANVRVGSRVGVYEIVEEIGLGGMGEVYRAFRADDQYSKEVAIKLVRAGQDSRQVLAHFRNERQLLASLDHPNIARLLDGGTTEDGVPYFAMELIEGEPINEYCDSKRLSITERLKLFLQVCSALQYAHQRLIIHRDLKPGNILVTREGTPKLLDFGIAKIFVPSVEGAPDPTISIFRALTPAYASPEQIKGETITTASDVYSLGVLLYEALTGQRPYRGAGTPYEIAQAVCEVEPVKPSSVLMRNGNKGSVDTTTEERAETIAQRRDASPEKLRKRLRGDLDNIVLMALRKEPQRRYSSAEQFATDIRRHLENLPVTATKDTLRYRTSKFVRRHKAGALAAVTVSVTLLAGVAAVLHEARIARQQQQRAEQRFNDVRELANSLMFEVHDSIQDLPGSTPARKLLVERALRYLDRLSHDAASDVSLQRELATAYERVGTVQGNPFGANLGDINGALESYRKALSIRESLSKTDPENFEDLVALARNQRLYAATLANRTEGWDEKNNSGNELLALATVERAYQIAPSDLHVLHELEANYGLLVTFSQAVGDHQTAFEFLKKQQVVLEAHLQANPNDRNVRIELAQNRIRSGEELAPLGFSKEALDSIRQGISTFTALSADDADARAARYLALSYKCLGDALLMISDVSNATNSYRTEVAILEELERKDTNNAVVQFDLATAVARLGNAMALEGPPEAGLKSLERAATMLELQIHRDPSYNEPPWSLALTKLWMADALARMGQNSAALESYRTALGIWKGDNQPVAKAISADIHVQIAKVLGNTANVDDAFVEANSAVAVANKLLTSHPHLLDARYVLADAYAELGNLSKTKAIGSSEVADQTRHWNEARGYYQQSLDSWHTIHNPGTRAPAEFACGNPKQVERELARCDAKTRELQAGLN